MTPPGIRLSNAPLRRNGAAGPLPVEAAVIAVRTHRVRDQVVRNVVEVDLEFSLKPAELRPHHPVEGALAGATMTVVRRWRAYR